MKDKLEELGFKETYKNYFTKDAPGRMLYFTKITVDMRFYHVDKSVVVVSRRGTEEEFIFKGFLKTEKQLKQILTWTHAI